MSNGLVAVAPREISWGPLTGAIVVGKDILELLSSSMYVDPMAIYREYVQNAADSIDEAQARGLLVGPGRIDVGTDAETRTVTITDNGTGLPHDEFVDRLTAFGASRKRGSDARGFRGVGRLAGIGYCQELIFRTRIEGAQSASELRWDCKKFKHLLRTGDASADLSSAVAQIVSVRRREARDLPERFFSVELRGIVRHRNDQLLNPLSIADYLSQVAPLPLHPDFPFANTVLSHLHGKVRLGNVQIYVDGMEKPLCRPHAVGIDLGPDLKDPFTEIELISVPGVDGETAALGWIAHHGYIGALPPRSPVRGLRVRSGNIQIGDDRLFEDLFPEPRFNAWAVGEVHVVDQRITPNGRRDHFEQNVHFHNLLTHLAPSARDIARRCRTSSLQRKWVRDFELRETVVRGRVGIIRQGAVGRAERHRLAEEIRESLVALEQIAKRGELPLELSDNLRKRLEKVQRDCQRLFHSPEVPSPWGRLPAPKRRAYEHIIGLVYECSTNQATAKLLVDKILARFA
jgi:molecular chaperone HtpG